MTCGALMDTKQRGASPFTTASKSPVQSSMATQTFDLCVKTSKRRTTKGLESSLRICEQSNAGNDKIIRSST